MRAALPQSMLSESKKRLQRVISGSENSPEDGVQPEEAAAWDPGDPDGAAASNLGSQSAALPAGYRLLAIMHADISLDMAHVCHLQAHMEHNVTSRHEGGVGKGSH